MTQPDMLLTTVCDWENANNDISARFQCIPGFTVVLGVQPKLILPR